MKLKIELVPTTAWYSNLRKKISQEKWDIIRKESYADADHKCSICKAKIKLNCHEIWEYNDKNHIQTLKGFIALCDKCHGIKHLGFAGTEDYKGPPMDELIDHFMKVNKVSKRAFEMHKKKSFLIHNKRSQHEWRTDLAQWLNLVNQ